MQVKVGRSKNQNIMAALDEAFGGVNNPSFLLIQAPYGTLETIAQYLANRFPGVQNLCTSGTTYNNESASDQELDVVAFGSDAKVAAGALEGLSLAPLKNIDQLDGALNFVQPGKDDTVCLEYCTNDEEVTITSLNVALEKRGVPLVGGTVFGAPEGQTSYVMVNGRIYSDACGFVVIKNLSGKIRTYSENIYHPSATAPSHIATKVNLANKELISLDGRPAADVYSEDTGLSRSEIIDNVLKQPLGRVVGDKCYISSMHDMGANGSLINYKRINENDTISVLELGDFRSINQETFQRIRGDFPKASFIFSVNCIYRHLLFTNENYLNEFIRGLGQIGPHVGYVGGGEQYGKQHVNQTMVCAVFE